MKKSEQRYVGNGGHGEGVAASASGESGRLGKLCFVEALKKGLTEKENLT